MGPQPLPPLSRTVRQHASACRPSICAAVLEVWDRSRCLHELHVPKSLHGGVFNDGWFGTGGCSAACCRCAVALQLWACDLAHAVVVTQCSSASTLSTYHHCAPTLGLPTTGAAWSPDETRVAYVAEAPPATKTPEWCGAPAGSDGKKPEGAAAPKGWRGLGEWTPDWGELFTGEPL